MISLKALTSKAAISDNRIKLPKKCSECGEEYIECYDPLTKELIDVIPCICGYKKEREKFDLEANERYRSKGVKNENYLKSGLTQLDYQEVKKPPIISSETKELYTALKQFADEFDSTTDKGVYIGGTPGIGKTSFAKRVAFVVMKKGFSVYFTNEVDLIDNGKKRFKDNYITNAFNKAQECDLLILDDLGIEAATEYVKSEMSKLIDYRYSHHRPIIYISNRSFEQMKNRYDNFGRTYSRIRGGCEKIWWIPGRDLRINDTGK